MRLWRTGNEAAVEEPCTHANQITPFSDNLSTLLKSVTTAPCHKSLWFFFYLYILHIYLLMNVLAPLQEWRSHFQRPYLNRILKSNDTFFLSQKRHKQITDLLTLRVLGSFFICFHYRTELSNNDSCTFIGRETMQQMPRLIIGQLSLTTNEECCN